MAERYTRLFALSGRLYTPGTPVLIEAGALLKDNQTGRVLVQLKLKSISPNQIKAVKVNIQPLDVTGAPLGDSLEHTYLDLTANRDAFFGQQTPVTMANPDTRGFNVVVSTVVFSDNTVWNSSGAWAALDEPTTVESIYSDENIQTQFKIEIGGKCVCVPTSVQDLWYCACGELNSQAEQVCHVCGRDYQELAALVSELTEDKLRADYETRRKDNVYATAKNHMTGENISEYEAAINIFRTIPGWKDADEQIEVCEKKIEEIKAKEEHEAEERRVAAEKAVAAAAKRKKRVAIITSVAVACIAFAVVLITVIIPNAKYNSAVALMENGEYEAAIEAFKAMEGYKDSDDMIVEAENRSVYATALDYMESGKYEEAIEQFESLGEYSDAQEKSKECQNLLNEEKYQEADALVANGQIAEAAIAFEKLTGFSDARDRSLELWNQCAVRDSLSGGYLYTVGLKSDGTVVAVGDNYYGQCDVSDWTDIVAISAGYGHTVGLKSDGTVVAVGCNEDGRCDVSDWTDIVAISASNGHTVGLESDGTVVAVGCNEDGRCDVSNWTDIVAISAGGWHTVGLKSDGTVVAVGYIGDGQCNVSDWTDIVAISAGGEHTVGLRSDGTVVAAGDNSEGQCDVSDWTDIKLP
jgi:tetratricopeptide (TPR) repeat protein